MFQDRGFFYENAVVDNEIRLSKRQGRIRVQAGDKRVPPAKSKPRQRRQVTPADHSTLCMDCVDWSDQNYSVQQLVRAYSKKFPIIVKVTQGYYDKVGLELTTNEVLQIHDSSIQKRVDAVDSLGRNLSIPADFPLYVTPTDGNRAGDRLTFSEASASLPVRVKVLKTSSDNSSKYDLTGQMLLLSKVTNDVFLRANAINGGWIDQAQVNIIPSMFDAEFSVAEGMRGASNDEWIDYKNMFYRTVRHLMVGDVQGYPEIFIADQSRRASEVIEPLYDNIIPKTNPDVVDAHRGSQNQYINIPLKPPPPPPSDTITLSRPDTPFSDIDEEDLGELFADVIKVGERTNIHLTDVSVEVHTPPPDTDSFSSVKSLLQNFTNEEKTGIDNKGHNHGPPRAVVQPTVQKNVGGSRKEAVTNNSAFVSVVNVDMAPLLSSHERKIIYDDRSSASLKPYGQSSIRTMDDVPELTDSLTVADMSQCLRLLNMEAHVATFESHQVDGGLLCTLNEKVLCDDFRLTPFNASKLLRFARGWRPKLS